MTNVSISQYISYIGRNAFENCTSLKTISVNSANSKYSSNSGILFDKEKTKLIKYPSNKTDISNYTVPNTVTTIEIKAFKECKGLSEIKIPTSVTKIETGVFEKCSNLTKIQLPNSITSIGIRAFNSCESLESITIPNKVTSIGFKAFYQCSA